MLSLASFRSSENNSRAGAWYLVLIALVLLSTTISVFEPLFLTPNNLSNVAAQIAPLLITAIGQALVMITGGLDLSVGSQISLYTGIVVLDAPTWMIVMLLFGTAVAIGTINGVGIAYLNVHPIIMTLASMNIVQGFALLVRPVPGGTVPEWVETLVSGGLFGLPSAVTWMLFAVIIAAFLLYRSRYGLHLFAIGGNPASAHLYGISVKRNIVFTYVICALFATLAGVFLAGRIASGDPNVGGVFALDSITAAALGGTSFSGGVGSLVGTIAGAVIVGVIGNGMNIVNVSAFLQTVIKGLLLLVIVSIQRRKEIGL